MYLKSLEIQGFKSFPDKTVLQFGSDITAIVGPNGSGKSNISDAISWVLGEQSSRALRGAKMEDVIFGGTQKRAPVGFAEATLVLDNSDGTLRMETPEVSITRRYYRSGESEYYINRESARLRDIHELLMDTGLGREGYSNIGQGKIDEILSLKSTDRREVFEEAAGISKCRYRRAETERRLAATEDNLLRIGDKISELELQVEPLREQAEKAKKYLILREELKGFEITIWLDTLEKLSAAAKKAEQDYASAAFMLEQAHSELNALYASSEQLSLELNRQSLMLDEKHEAIMVSEQEKQKAEAELSVLEAGMANCRENMQRVQTELSEQEGRSGGIAESIAQQQTRLDEIAKELTELNAALNTSLEKNRALIASTDAQSARLLDLRARHALLLAESAEHAAQLAALQASGEEAAARRKALEDDHAAALARHEDAARQTAACAKALHEAQENVQSCQNTIAGYMLRQQTQLQRRDALQKQLGDVNVELDTARARQRMLHEMERDYEGFSKAVKAVMQEASRGVLRGVHGPVSALLRTPDEYTTAIETALGAAMQNLVVDTDEDAKAGIRYLKRTDAGRATFLPLQAIRGRSVDTREFAAARGYVGLASELVQFDPHYRDIADYLLGRTVVAKTLDDAVQMARVTGNRTKIVTLDGQVLNPGGSMTGGSASRSAGVLSRANQIERLGVSIAQLEEKQKQLTGEADKAAAAAAKTEFELKAVQQQLREAEDEALRRTEEEKQVRQLLQALQDNLDSYDAELARLNSRDSADIAKTQMLQSLRDKAQKQADALAAQIETLEQGQLALSEEGSALSEHIQTLRMDSAAREAERQSAQDSIRQLQALQSAMQGDRTQKEQLLRDYEAQLHDFEARCMAQQSQIARLEAQTQARRDELKQASDARAQIEAKRNQTEKQAQEKNQNILLLERESARLEQKKATSELEEKQLIDRLWDSYELTPTTAAEHRIEIESQTAAQKRITELRRKISALGTPNLGAIDEFARVNERYEYLTGQRDDVLHARGELESIIRSVTDEMTEIFVREFGRINEYFGQTFTEMFSGGKGELVLEDPSQPLECGIEIKVQPPGKQVKTITLLSGGEKAFVAIALYFAILKVRPTPFCMLDEIDAALDDRNVERFALYLHSLCKKTQFIVITHRRGTMEAADMLYGVTMQEQGISKILHIRMDELEQQLGITS